MGKHSVWVVTIYYAEGPHTYSGNYDYIRKVREVAIERNIACSGMKEFVTLPR